MVSVVFSPHALQELGKIDAVIGKRIVEKVVWLQQNFDSVIPKRLHFDLKELYKLRVGDCRVIYAISENGIAIKAVRHRREVYK